ncbi:hypothetical protein I2486_18285, partial [Cellulophaga sp. E16_2]|uniref:hypothetical protein n=1 Tax=Cellulophaga sp. E16_2 TaxID=2789297 RepID=UPI001A91A6D5
TLKLEIHTHSIIKKDLIIITCKLGGQDVSFKYATHVTFVDDFKYNGKFTVNIAIDPNWKDEIGHKEGNIENLLVLVSINTAEAKLEEDSKIFNQTKDQIKTVKVIKVLPNQSYQNHQDPIPLYKPSQLKKAYTFKVNYKGSNELITERTKTVANMVELGDELAISAQSDVPCKYISIEITRIGSADEKPLIQKGIKYLIADKKGKEKIKKENKSPAPEKRDRIFIAFVANPDGSLTDHTATNYCVVAGNNINKQKVNISVGGLETKGCIAYEHEHDVKSVFEEFKAKASAQWVYPNDYKINDSLDKMDLELTYPYMIRDDNDLLKYFWPASLKPQLFFVPIQTCAYPKQGVRILVYPDIVWAITFTYGKVDPKQKEEWRKDLSDNKKSLLEEHEKTNSELQSFLEKKLLPEELQKKLEKLRYYKKLIEKLSEVQKLKLSIKVAYDLTAVDFDTLANKIINIAYAFTLAKAVMDEMVGSDVPDEEKENLVQKQVGKLGKLGKFVGKLPITIQVENPKLSFGATWGRSVFSEKLAFQPTAPYEVNVFLKADPLFEASGVLDIITCCQFIPAAGQAINAVMMVLESTGVQPVFTLTAKGSISLGAEGKIHFDKNNNASKLEVKNTNTLKLIVEASITADGGFAGFLFAGGDLEGLTTKTTYGVYAETGFEASFSIGVEAGEGPFLESKFEFLGVVAVGKKITEINGLKKSSKEAFKYTIIEKTLLLEGKHYFK